MLILQRVVLDRPKAFEAKTTYALLKRERCDGFGSYGFGLSNGFLYGVTGQARAHD